MANPFLKDRSNAKDGEFPPDYSRTDSSQAADRRSQQENGVTPEFGSNRAPQLVAPIDLIWRAGSLPPSDFLAAPFSPVESNDPNDIEVREIEINQYGDCYDPTSPMRVRTANWNFDPDHDGEVA